MTKKNLEKNYITLFHRCSLDSFVAVAVVAVGQNLIAVAAVVAVVVVVQWHFHLIQRYFASNLDPEDF